MADAKLQDNNRHATCKADGCSNRATRVGHGLCEKHYTRLRRRGSLRLALEDAPPPREVNHSNGYILEYVPSHPLASRTTMSRVYQHRRVYYDAYGEGPFACYWCGDEVGWHDMHVDHLNAIRDDNRLKNLVPSCGPCNQSRGTKKTHVERLSRTITFRGETRTLLEWATSVGITRESLQNRLRAGWPLERALTEPRGKAGPRRQA